MTSKLTLMSPGGHRVVLKVNNNSPLCLGLEEACKQFELESSWFGLKHIKRCLDVSLTFRQSGVPNNATLELYKLDKERVSASVRIALQLQDGSRVMGIHLASSSLWEVLSTAEKEGGLDIPLCYPGGVPTRVPCLEYTKIRVIGEEELRCKSLESLGIFSGSAIIRYSTVESQEIPKTISEDVTVLKGYRRPAVRSDQTAGPAPSYAPIPIHQMTVLGQGVSHIDPVFSELMHTPWSFDHQIEEERMREEERKQPRRLFSNPGGWNHDKGPFDDINLSALLPYALIPAVPPEDDYIAQFNARRAEKTGVPLQSDDGSLLVVAPPTPPLDPVITPRITPNSPVRRVYEEACPRDICVFHLDKNEYSDVSPAEVDESFFEPTFNEAVKRQKDLEKDNELLYDSPLTIQSYKKVREVPHPDKYDKTVIRVVLPNRLVLQGVFRSGEPVKALVSFIRESLVDPKLKFHLFTTPPKRVIKNGKVTFKEANLIPATNVLIALDEAVEGLLLREELLEQVSTQLEADVRSSKERVPLINATPAGSIPDTASAELSDRPEESTQSGPAAHRSRKQGGGNSKGSGKPKWLKIGK